MIQRLDPLASAQAIDTTYRKYLKTLLAPSDPAIAHAFDRAVDNSPLLTKGPLLELTPPYAPGRTIRELVDEGVLSEGLLSVASRGLDADRPLYVHQETAIRKAVAGRNLVVSTGTGSGKTESFLIPILNSLMAERTAGTLGPGVRALLLYPMNALVNDQLARLRDLLQSTPDITFGRYTSEALGKKAAANAKFKQMHKGQEPLKNELLSREEMRATPPHILLTNYAMLEYLLIRPIDLDLFEGEHSGTWRFIALDEAHVYDGAKGTEVALLLRRLRTRVAAGRSLQCIATSASLTGSPTEAMRFASNLFDVPFEYVDAEPDRQDLVVATHAERYLVPKWRMTDEELLRWASPNSQRGGIAQHSERGNLAHALLAEERIGELRALLTDGSKRTPRDVRQLAATLWPDDPVAGQKLEALVALGSSVKDEAGNPVLSARYHYFVRASEGAFVGLGDVVPKVFLSRHEKDPETGRAVFEFGACVQCGAVHLAGHVVSNHFIPAKGDDARKLKWLVLSEVEADPAVDEDEEALADDARSGQVGVRFLCTGCGLLMAGAGQQCSGLGCPGGAIRRVREHPGIARAMGRCLECGARSRNVARRLRTDTNAAPAVVTAALYQRIPPAGDESAELLGEGRKLLLFSDSRQQAAFAAPYLENSYSRILERRFLVKALDDPAAHASDLSPEGLALLLRDAAVDTGYFHGDAVQRQAALHSVVTGELLALDQRQSLEGLGLLRISLMRSGAAPMPNVLARLGMNDVEFWDLLDLLTTTVRRRGALSLLPRVDVRDERFAPRNVEVRIREAQSGRNLLSWTPSGRPGTTNNRVRIVEKVLRALGSDADVKKVLELVWSYLLANGFLTNANTKVVQGAYRLNHQKLEVRAGGDCRWFACSNCRSVTAFNVRSVCPNPACSGTLERYQIPGVDEDTNHYRDLYRTLNPAPMKSMEHTAQWDAERAAEIQQEFIGGKVNVLSCSTTFELGVDVGDLQSVVMRNMPPKTANYVQRAGRAGRRADSAALVMTYANRNSHDLSRYQDPVAMISGEMRIPWIPIDNERIGRRHAHSVAISAFFRDSFVKTGREWKSAGDFFIPEDGMESAVPALIDYLTPVPIDVRTALRSALPASVQLAIGVGDDAWVKKLAELLDLAQQDVVQDVKTFKGLIAEAVDAENYGFAKKLKMVLNTIRTRELIGYLAKRNILPKYGFPVDTVELRTVHCTDEVGEKLELERDLSQAIYDYAPGAQTVAGGRVWTSAGLYTLPKKALPPLNYRVCSSCSRFQCSSASFDSGDSCPSCETAFGPSKVLVQPEFGFVAERATRDVGTEPPERYWSGAKYVEDTGHEIGSWRSQGALKVTARAGNHAWIAVVADGHGAGFRLCGKCGWARALAGGPPKHEHDNPQTGKPCDGRSFSLVALGHRYQTDVAEFTFDDVAYSAESQANWLSTLYALLEGASESLEISRDDIDGALSWNGGRRSIVLFDTVPAGAGAAKRIAENLDLVLAAAEHRVRDCECGEETACYGCLWNYGNKRHHEDLSRRGALAILERLRVATGTARS